jgi:PRTRC genetic system protein E
MFTELVELMGDNSRLNIIIAKVEEGLVVSIIPKVSAKDQAVDKVKPLILRGTPQEIEDNFIDAISGPIKSTTEFFDNVVEHEKSLEKAAEESKIAETEKKKKKEESEKAKKELEKELKKMEEHLEREQYATVIQRVSELNAKGIKSSKLVEMKAKAEKMKAELPQVDMFDMIDEVEKESTQSEDETEEDLGYIPADVDDDTF